MKDQFSGYYRPEAREIEAMWRDGIIVLDTNVLLDVFRVTTDTANQLVDTLERLHDRLWLPHQVALEYHQRVDHLIAAQTKPYDQAEKTLSELLDSFLAPRGHPFLHAELLDEVKSLFDRVSAHLRSRKVAQHELLHDNPTKERIAELFDGLVGQPFTPDELKAIHEEGRSRFERNIPPGFADKKSKPEPDRYGDYILWRQLLDCLRTRKQPGLLVTSDAKEDWFLRIAGRTLGPRPELIQEVRSVADTAFHMYPTTAFLEHANQFFDARVKPEAIQEVTDLERLRLEDTHRKALQLAELSQALINALGAGADVATFMSIGSDRWSVRLVDGRRYLALPEGKGWRLSPVTPAKASSAIESDIELAALNQPSEHSHSGPSVSIAFDEPEVRSDS